MDSALPRPFLRIPASVPELVAALDRDGVVEIPGLVTQEWIEASREHLSDNLREFGARDFTVIDPDSTSHRPASDLVTDPTLIEFLQRTAELRWPRARGDEHRLPSFLRVLAGPERHETPGLLHYDAYVVTIVIPIELPTGSIGDPLGELIVLPNHRPFRRTLAMHAADKLLTHNRRYRARVTRRALQRREETVVRMTPGNGYAFWGYRAFHGNLPCAPDQLRATLIVHYGDPHAGSAGMRAARRLSPARRGLRRLSPDSPLPGPAAQPTSSDRSANADCLGLPS